MAPEKVSGATLEILCKAGRVLKVALTQTTPALQHGSCAQQQPLELLHLAVCERVEWLLSGEAPRKDCQLQKRRCPDAVDAVVWMRHGARFLASQELQSFPAAYAALLLLMQPSAGEKLLLQLLEAELLL